MSKKKTAKTRFLRNLLSILMIALALAFTGPLAIAEDDANTPLLKTSLDDDGNAPPPSATPSPSSTPAPKGPASVLRRLKAKIRRAVAGQQQGSTASQQKRVLTASADRSSMQTRIRGDDAPAQAKEWDLRVGLIGGVMTIGSLGLGGSVPSSPLSGSSGGNSLNADFLIGVPVDFQTTYFGAGLDTYYATATASNNSSGSNAGLQAYGGMLDIRGQYPLQAGSVRFLPKAGLGYGILALTGGRSSDAAYSSVGADANASGVYGMLGVDIELFEGFTLGGDFSQSITGSSSVKLTGIASLLNQQDQGQSGGIQRIRVGIRYRVFSRFLIGLHYLQHMLELNLPSSGIGAQQMQLLQAPQRALVLSFEYQF